MNVHAKEFNESARRYTADLRHRDLIQKALSGYYAKRDEYKNRFQNWSGARDLAAEIKWEAINHLDRYLDEFVSKLEARGTKVFWAPGAQEARDYIVGVARQHKVRSIIKSKSMTAEEIHLNEALEKEGFEVVESDLGEYIVQLRQEPPYHLVFPAMHLTRQQISDLFHDKLGSEPTNNPEDLTMIARRVMRRKYCEADMGISGANFAIAETGMISITENEGNARLTTSLPKIHVALVGIEKVLPKLSDLALVPADVGDGGRRTVHHLLQHTLRRTASTRRTRRPGGISRRAAGQSPHGTAGGRRTARRAPLHPLRRLFERVPDFQKRRRAQLRHHLSRPDWLGHHSASARASGLETFVAGLVPVRRLHRNLSRQNQFASSFVAQPAQRGAHASSLPGKTYPDRFCAHDAPAGIYINLPREWAASHNPCNV